jgi:thiamine-phosphate pyrophosphorylase
MFKGSGKPIVYLVTHPHPTWFEQVTYLISEGVSIVQIRDKSASDERVSRDVEAVLDFVEQGGFECTVLLNDRVELAREFNIGVHLGQSDMLPSAARKILGVDAPIGWTIHDRIDLIATQKEYIQYVGVGPVFPTQTKLDTQSVLGISRLKEVCHLSSVPVVAIGGIDKQNIESVYSAQPWGIAMSSALMQTKQLKPFLL